MSIKKSLKYIKDNKEVYLFIAPAFISFLIFIFYPIVGSWRFAFYDWSGIGGIATADFVGLENIKNILQDSFFWNAFKNNLTFSVTYVPILLIVSFIFAIILNTKIKGKVIYRSMFYLPVVTSMAIIGVLMTFIFSGKGGPVNEILMLLNIIDRPINWLGNPNYSMKSVVTVGVWRSTGIYIVYWLAGLQTIPKELYEAADVDGASFFDKLRHITLPMLKKYAVIITLLAITVSLRVFSLVTTMTGGGPFKATEVVTLFIYRNAFGSSGVPKVGYASAAAVVFGTIIIVFSFGIYKLRGMIKKT